MEKITNTLFSFNPLSSWIYDYETLEILEVNNAAIKHYGYSREEFLSFTLKDLRPPKELSKLVEAHLDIKNREGNISFGVFTHQKNNGTLIQMDINGHKVDFNGRACILVVCQDVTETLNTQKQLEINSLFNRTIIESSPDCLKVLDADGRLQFMNFNGLCQMEIDDFSIFKDKNWWTLWGAENEELVKESLNKALLGETVQFTAFCPTAKGTPKWWDVMVSPVGKAGEEVQQIISVSRDITQQKKEEQRLKLLESVITNTRDSIIITEAEPLNAPGPKIVYVNEAFTKMTGYEAEEVIGKSPRILQGPNTDRNELARLSKALKNWEPCEATIINYKKNGEEFWINFSIAPVADETGWFTHWISIERDVTEVKQKALEKELLSNISLNFNSLNDLLTSSKEICETICDFGQFDFVELWLPNIEKTQIQLVANKLRTVQAEIFFKQSEEVKSFAQKQGLPGIVWNEKSTILWDNVSKKDDFVRKEAAEKASIQSALGIPLRFNEEVVGVLLIATQNEKNYLKKHVKLFEQLEQFLGSEISRKKLENDLSHLYQAIPDIICLVDFQGRFLKMNKAGFELLGYDEDEILYETCEKFVHPEDHNISINEISQLSEGKKTFNFENRYITKNGKIIWLSWIGNSSVEEGIIYATAKNITEEKKLRELNKQAGVLAKIGSWEVDVVNSKTFWSDVTHQLHETDSKNFVPNFNDSLAFYREDFRPKIISLFERSILYGEKFDYEAILITAKNNERWVRVIGGAEFVDGKCKRLYGSFQDIHERKVTELALHESESKFRTIFEIATLGIAQVDPSNGKVILANSYYETITGYTVDELLKMSFIELTHPDDRTKDWELFSKAARGEGEYRNEKRYIKKDGTIVWVRLHVAFIRNEEGKPIKTVAICEDISDRKEAEEAILDSEEKRRLIMSGALDAIICIDTEERITFWNNQAENIFGWKETEVLGQALSELIIPEPFRKYHTEGMKRYLETGVEKALNVLLELSALNRNGDEFPIELTVIPIKQGGDIFFCAFVRNISQRKIAEQEKNNLLATLENSLNEIYIFDSETFNFNYVNKGALINLGYTEDEMKMLTPFDLKPSYTLASFKNLVTPLMNNENEKIVFFTYHQRKNGSLYPVEVHLQLVVQGKNKRFLAIILDISERRKAEELLAISFEEKNSILESISDAFYAMDENWNVTYFNKEAENLLKKKSNDVLGKNIWEEFSPAKGTLLENSYRSVLATGKSETFEYWYPGDSKWYEINVYPSKGGISVFFKNIDEKRKAAEELQKAYQEKNSIVESIADAFFTMDHNSIVSYWNRSAEELLGVKREQLIGKNLWEVFPDAVSFPSYVNYHKVLETKQPITFEDYYDKWLEINAYPSEEGITVIFRDISLRKEADIRLIQANERFEKVTQATSDAIWDWDIINDSFYRSQNIQKFFGNSTSIKLDTKDFWTDSFQQDDLEYIKKSLYDALNDPNQNRWEAEYRIHNESRTTVYVIDRGLIIRDSNGKAIRMIGAMTDITKSKIQEKELLSLNTSLQNYAKDLERSNEELEQFAFITSHDLQEPLRMISSFMDQLKRKYEDQLDEKALQYIHFATDGAKRMKRIILDLLEYSRAGQPTESIEKVNVNELLSDYKQLRRKVISEKSVTISAPELPTLYSYKAALTQIFHSLLDNSIKYSKEKTLPYIEIKASENTTEWQFSIKDNGIGIETEFFEKIFTIFQRLHNRSEYEGTGIGLSIAKRHVEFLGGKIWLDSIPDNGTTFYFTLPKNHL